MSKCEPSVAVPTANFLAMIYIYGHGMHHLGEAELR